MKFLSVAVLALAGCGSFTHYQTAPALDAGGFAYDVQASSVAMSRGVHMAGRFRAGLGRGFEVGAETDMISLLLFGMTLGPDGYGLVMGDVKWQFLEEPAEGSQDGAPFSCALGAGGGTGYLSDFYFAQVTASRKFDIAEPYLAWRYQRMRIDLDFHDPDDVHDLRESYLERVFDEADEARVGLHHIFVGVKIWLADHMYLMPEASLILGDADGVGSFGIAFGFQTP